MERHMLEKHKHTLLCDCCEIAFKTKEKLKQHICKVVVKNPTSCSLYTKNWYNAKGCNPIYCLRQNQDVAWLHYEKCWKHIYPCSFAPYLSAHRPVQEGEIKHLQLEDFIKNGEILWQRLTKEIKLAYTEE
jgi:hypothetical protein